ncbi:hypothetical protein VTI74DRAFT_851 [Chaetomium olivicolor]
MLCSKSLASFAGVALLSYASAQTQSPQPSDSYSYARAPWSLPDATYDKLMEKSNATSKYPLQAPDTSAPFPAPGPIDGWSLTVSVVADVPMAESPLSVAHTFPNFTFTGNRIVLRAPTGPDSAVDDSWHICVLQWTIDPYHFEAKLRDDDGSCSSVVSDQCARDVEKAAAEGYMDGRTGRRQCFCPGLSTITSCSREEAKALNMKGSCIAQDISAANVNSWPDGKYNVVSYGGPPRLPGNQTDYERVASLAWPMLILWGPSDNATSGGLGSAGVVANLACPRAKGTTLQRSSEPGNTTNTDPGNNTNTEPGNGTTTGDHNAGSGGTSLSSKILVAGVMLAGGLVSL